MSQNDHREGDALSAAIDRNVAALMKRDAETARLASAQQRLADRITGFAGSMPFVYLHLVAFGGWIIANLGVIPGVAPWDPSMVVLAMIASVEAIFISTFVLISQNRMGVVAERRAQLDLQISLLAEHETTRLMTMVQAIADRLEVTTPVDDEVRELQRDTEPDAVLTRIEEEQKETEGETAKSAELPPRS